MSNKTFTKTSQRFVMYIPNDLRQEIDAFVGKKGITLAEFGRHAFESYLENLRLVEVKRQLAETCRLLAAENDSISKLWAAEENGNWPI